MAEVVPAWARKREPDTFAGDAETVPDWALDTPPDWTASSPEKPAPAADVPAAPAVPLARPAEPVAPPRSTFTPAEQAADETGNRAGANRRELSRAIQAAPSAQVRTVLEGEQARIQLPAPPSPQPGSELGQRATLHLPKRPTAVLPAKKPPPEASNLPGFIFKDFIPGAVESTFGGLYNAGVGALTALPAAGAAALEGLDPNLEGTDFIDRFRARHQAAGGLLEWPMQTYTGERAVEMQSELVDFALDKLGFAVANAFGPMSGAMVKGGLAAMLAGAGLRLGKGTGLKATIDRSLEPTFDPLSDAPGGRAEPQLPQALSVRSDVEPSAPKTMPALAGPGPEPQMGAVPQIPLRTIEKPRLKGPVGVLGPPQDVSTPMGSAPPETASSAVPKVRDAQLDAPAAAGTFALPAAQNAPGSTQPSQGPLPRPPRAQPSPATPAPESGGFTPPDTETEYTAGRNIASDVRKGGAAGGEQYVKLPQAVFWKGPTGKLDAALFDSGKQFKTESTDGKIRADAVANKAAAFDRLQALMRYFLLEDKSIPANLKDPYRQFLTDDGTQISRDRLQQGATAYNVRVSTLLKNARRANEGQGVAIEAPAWRGEEPPAPSGPRGASPSRTQEGGTPQLPEAPGIERPPEVKAALDEPDAVKASSDEYGPGTLGANPMFDPALWKKALGLMSKLADKTSKPVRAWFDAAQTVPDTAVPVLASSWEYALKVGAAKLQAETDLYHKTDTATLARDYKTAVAEALALDPQYLGRPGISVPRTPREAVQQIELARRHTAKIELQRDLVSSGYASPVPLEGYSQSALNLADMKTSAGRSLYIRDDAKAIIDQMVGAHDVAQQAYRNSGLLGAAEAVNQASVGLIMFNPGFHVVTVAGRAAPFIFNKLGTNSILAKLPEGMRKLQDRDYMYDLMKNKGYQPMRIRDSQQALGGQMGAVEKAFRRIGLDKPYDFWRTVHNKVMVDTVNKIQMSFYLMKVDDLVKTGMPRDAAELAASRMSNLIGGNLPKHEINQLWHQILGSTMFSRGYTSTVVRQATRAVTEDKILMAALAKRGHTPETVAKAVKQYRTELQKALALDYIVMQLTGNLINYAMTDGVEDRYGVKRRHFSWDNKPKDKPMGSRPDKMDYAFPDRIYIGQAKDGKDVYMENPLRTTRDQMLFFTQGKELAAGEKPKWLSRKLGTLAGLTEDAVLGQDRGGRPMRDTLDVAANVFGRMTPLDFKTPAEAVRMSSFDYFADALSGALSDPAMIALKLGGLQPHEEGTDPTVGASAKVKREQDKVWAEAGEIKRNWPNLGAEARAAALKRLREIGEPAGIKEHVLEKYVEGTEASKAQRKRVTRGEKVFE